MEKEDSTEFQLKCYKALKKIPRGMVATYGDIAKIIGEPKATQAVGQAMNMNKSTEVPCHRVVAADGFIGGFNKDIKIKIIRLENEGVKVVADKIVDFEKIRFKKF